MDAVRESGDERVTIKDLRKKLPCTVNILGTPYTVEMKKYDEDKMFSEKGFGAYCWEPMKMIVVGNLETFPGNVSESSKKDDISAAHKCERHNLRHEIVHAYLNESGLSVNAFNPKDGWAKNEEMVDWIAIQSPKLFKTFIELGVLE